MNRKGEGTLRHIQEQGFAESQAPPLEVEMDRKYAEQEISFISVKLRIRPYVWAGSCFVQCQACEIRKISSNFRVSELLMRKLGDEK